MQALPYYDVRRAAPFHRKEAYIHLVHNTYAAICVERNVVIRIAETTRTRLKELGRKGETYDEIVTRLLEEAEKER